jgi:CRP-like cAMP-binding protein
MISPELLRRYDFFSGLNNDQIITLAKLANEISVEEGHYFFHEGDTVTNFYLVVEGAVGIVLEVPDQAIQQPVSGQLTGKMKTRDITVTTVGTGTVFGWPGIIPPHDANATAKSLAPCRVFSFRCDRLHEAFEKDRDLAYKMTLNAAQIIRDRLRDMQIESLAYLSS